jgi:signal transduction histidine kinase
MLVNLVTNAIEAMAGIDGPRILSVKSEACDGSGVAVSVADTGPGIQSQDIGRIFDPLFTTVSVLPRRSRRGWPIPNAHRPKAADEDVTVDGAHVSDTQCRDGLWPLPGNNV